MFKAVAKMFDGEKQWDVIIFPCYETREEAEKGALKFVQDYDNNPKTPWLSVLWVQVFPA